MSSSEISTDFPNPVENPPNPAHCDWLGNNFEFSVAFFGITTELPENPEFCEISAFCVNFDKDFLALCISAKTPFFIGRTTFVPQI